MEVSVEKTDNKLERRLLIEVPAERVEGEITGRLKVIGKRARLKGFRPGKAPLKVLEQQFGPQVREEVRNDLINETYMQALQQQQLKPAGNPRIESSRIEPGANFRYTATIELYPELDLKPLDKLKVERPEVEITEADVDAMVEKVRLQRATWEPVERAARDGDQLTVDFEGKKDGEVFAGGTGKQVPVVLGSGRFLAGFEQQLVGASAGDTREFDLDFPSDYPNKQLAGQTAQFTVQVTQVAEQKLPDLDEAFCEPFGVDSIEELRKGVRENMQRELDAVVKAQVKERVLEQLVDQHPGIDLPQGLVIEEINRMRGEALQRMGATSGKAAPELPAQLFEEAARRRVALGLILGEIVRKESLKVDRGRVKARIEEIADGFDDPQQVLDTYAKNPRLVAGVEAMVLEDQAVELIVERAKVTPKKATFDAMMNPKQEDESK